jgi:hypothetical protein
MRFSAYTLAAAVALLSGMFVSTAPAQTKLTSQSTMNFLSIGIGARSSALGYSFITNTDDISSIFWNPAGIARLSGTRAFVDVNEWISDIKQFSFAGSQNFGDYGVLGLSFTTMDYGDIPGTAIELSAVSSGGFEYIETGPVKVQNYALGITYAQAISNEFSVGGQVKYAHAGLGSNTILQGGGESTINNDLSTLAFDLGSTYNTGFHDLTFSMALRNFSREVRYPYMSQGYYLPLVFTLGFSIDVVNLVDPGNARHSLQISVNGEHPTDFLEKASIGAEYSFDRQYFLRAGYMINYSVERVAFGLGARIPFSGSETLQFDYAYSLMKYFDGVHRFSISVVI